MAADGHQHHGGRYQARRARRIECGRVREHHRAREPGAIGRCGGPQLVRREHPTEDQRRPLGAELGSSENLWSDPSDYLKRP